jgi:hypothetical protein
MGLFRGRLRSQEKLIQFIMIYPNEAKKAIEKRNAKTVPKRNQLEE